MKQAVLQSAEEIIFHDVDFIADLARNEILVHIKRIGVCGSDIHAYKGKHPFTPLPVVQGHEYSAEVINVGSSVSKFKKGDKVTGRPQLTCGMCNPCKSGKYNVCQELKVQGFQAPGVAQDYFILPEDRAYKINEQVSFDEIALIEPAAVGAHCTSLIEDIHAKNIVISGAGPIGILIAQFAKAKGAKRIVVSDFNPFRLEMLHKLGITDTINLREESFGNGVRRILGDDGFQVGIEAVGHQAALDDLVAHVEKGGEVIIVGVYEEFPRVNMGFVGEHELTLKGSMMYKHEDYEEAIEFLNTNKINVKDMITHTFEFSDYNKAYKYINDNPNETLKVIINVND